MNIQDLLPAKADKFVVLLWNEAAVYNRRLKRSDVDFPEHDRARLAKFMEEMLSEVGFFDKAKLKSFALIVHLTEPSEPLSPPRLQVERGEMIAAPTAHWEEFAFLGSDEFFNFCAALTVQALLKATDEGHKLDRERLHELAGKYPRPVIEKSLLMYEPTIAGLALGEDQGGGELLDEELVFIQPHPYQYNVDLQWPLKDGDLDRINQDTRLVIFNADEGYHADDFVRINNAMLRAPNAILRIWYSTGTAYQDNFLKFFPSVKRLRLDGLITEKNCAHLPANLLTLEVNKPKSVKNILPHLPRLNRLQALTLTGNSGEDIELTDIVSISTLRALLLREFRIRDLTPLSEMEHLQSLGIYGCKIDNVDSIASISTLKHLALASLSLTNIDFVSRLRDLEFLNIDSFPKLSKIAPFSALTRLRRVVLSKVKRLTDLSSIAAAPKLEDLLVYDMRHLNVDDFRPFIGHATLKCIWTELGAKKDQQIMDMLKITGAGARKVFQFSAAKPLPAVPTVKRRGGATAGITAGESDPAENPTAVREETLRIQWKLDSGWADGDMLLALHDFEDEIDRILRGELIGRVDGHETGTGLHTIYCMGADARSMFNVLSEELDSPFRECCYAEIDNDGRVEKLQF